MKLDTVHHIAIIASDYEKSKHFYVELLGFEIVNETYREEQKDYILNVQSGTCRLEIFGIENPPKRPSYPEACGLRHLAFKVADVEEAIEELSKKGIEFEEIRHDRISGGRLAFFHDPDGLPLELHE